MKIRTERHFRRIEKAREAYEIHEGRKTLARYEDLRADTLGTMKRIYSELEIEVDEEELERAVNKYSWECIPEEKGQGKFHRKAYSGSWREDLPDEHAKMVEEITVPQLKEFYPEQI